MVFGTRFEKGDNWPPPNSIQEGVDDWVWEAKRAWQREGDKWEKKKAKERKIVSWDVEFEREKMEAMFGKELKDANVITEQGETVHPGKVVFRAIRRKKSLKTTMTKKLPGKIGKVRVPEGKTSNAVASFGWISNTTYATLVSKSHVTKTGRILVLFSARVVNIMSFNQTGDTLQLKLQKDGVDVSGAYRESEFSNSTQPNQVVLRGSVAINHVDENAGTNVWRIQAKVSSSANSTINVEDNELNILDLI